MKPIAPLPLRIAAFLIDHLIFLLVCELILLNFVSFDDPALLLEKFMESVLILLSVGLVSSFLYAYLISKFGGTVGKMLCGLSIVTPAGKNITYMRAFFRSTVGYMVSGSFVFLGFFWIFKDEKKRGWHDMVSETLVVSARRENLVVPLLGLIGIVILNILIFILILAKFQNQIPVYEQVGAMIQDEFAPPTPTPTWYPYRYHDPLLQIPPEQF